MVDYDAKIVDIKTYNTHFAVLQSWSLRNPHKFHSSLCELIAACALFSFDFWMDWMSTTTNNNSNWNFFQSKNEWKIVIIKYGHAIIGQISHPRIGHDFNLLHRVHWQHRNWVWIWKWLKCFFLSPFVYSNQFLNMFHYFLESFLILLMFCLRLYYK